MAVNPTESDPIFELQTPPTDGITKVKFFNACNKCIVSSWDTTVSIHELPNDLNPDPNNNNNDNSNNAVKLTEYKHEAGVLDVALTRDDSTIYSVGVDFALRSFDIEHSNNNNNNNNNTRLIGYHSQPIRCVDYYPSKNLVITGSWDKTIKLWDTRQPSHSSDDNNNNNNSMSSSSKPISTHTLGDKIFSMSMQTTGNLLIVATADRQVCIYDLRNMSGGGVDNKTTEQKRESSLKHQTRTVVCHPNNEQYVLASIEGRVAVEYLNTEKEYQTKKYAFKCHRQSVSVPANDGSGTSSKVQTIFPVNCVAFHPIYQTFATGGGDGVVNIWDGENKKRICQFPALSTSVASVSFNFDGTLVGIAQSYTWEKGELDSDEMVAAGGKHIKDNVIFRKIGDSQVKPKIKKKKAT